MSGTGPKGGGVNPGDDAPPGTPGTGENICPDCKGSGRVGAASCQSCGGTGKVIEGMGGG
jgi:DnaJ-class molecular chaperone